MSHADNTTRERILQAAEMVVPEQGLDGTSLRLIAAAADVHVPAISYHFGSRHGLVVALVSRMIAPFLEAHTRRLDELDTREQVDVVDAARAFVGGWLEASGDRHAASTIRVVTSTMGADTPAVIEGVELRLRPVQVRYQRLLGAILPWISRVELIWRMEVMVGILSMHSQGRFDALDLPYDEDPLTAGEAEHLLVDLVLGALCPNARLESTAAALAVKT